MTTKSTTPDDTPVVVHQVLLPIRGPVVGVCGAREGKAVALSQDVTCPDCRHLHATGVFELPDGRVVDAEAWSRGETILRDSPLVAALRHGFAGVGEQSVTDAEADPCPAWCDRTSGHSCTGEDFHHSGARTVEGLTVVLHQYPGEPVTVTLHSDNDRLLNPFAAKRIGRLLEDVEKAVAETAHCPSWCDQAESHDTPCLDDDHMSRVGVVDLSAHAEDEESMGYLALYLHQDADEAEPLVLLDGPDECAEARMTLAEAELLHATLGETLAAARKALSRS